MTRERILVACAAGALLGLFGGCGADSTPVADPESAIAAEFKGAPEWVISGECASPPVDDPDNTLCAVGQQTVRSASRIGLARSAAEAEGSAKLARILSKRVETLLDRYRAEYVEEAGDAQDAYEERTREAIREVAKIKLNGVKSLATWVSPKDNLYVLVAVQADAVKGALDSMNALSEAQKQAIDQHATELFDELDAAQP